MITFNRDKCTGCSACHMACLDQRDIQALRQAPLRYVTEQVQDGKLVCRSIGCTHCGLCMNACPMDCFYRSEEGYILLNPEHCISCHACVKSCPNGVISFSPETDRPIKCDGCIGRIRAGLLPACVHTCPTGALCYRSDS